MGQEAVTREDPEDQSCEEFIHLSKGVCTRTGTNVYHTVSNNGYDDNSNVNPTMDHSNPPIIRVDD